MSEHSPSDVLAWLKGAFSVNSVKAREVNFPCPFCNHESFYFNLQKEIGFCHRATCHVKPSLSDLIDLIGYGPSLSGYMPIYDDSHKPAGDLVVSLPEDAKPLAPMSVHAFHTRQDTIIKALHAHRGINIPLAEKFNIHYNDEFIFVPVYANREFVQYVGRRYDIGLQNIFDVPHKQRYSYFKGVSINKYIFNWDEAKNWPYITLVENTFNAIWLNEHNVTTNFGSYLSNDQINLLVNSRAKAVIFLWDGGTGKQSWKAGCALQAKGIKTGRIIIHNQRGDAQPDNFSVNLLEKSIEECLLAATKKSYNLAVPITIEVAG